MLVSSILYGVERWWLLLLAIGWGESFCGLGYLLLHGWLGHVELGNKTRLLVLEWLLYLRWVGSRTHLLWMESEIIVIHFRLTEVSVVFLELVGEGPFRIKLLLV